MYICVSVYIYKHTHVNSNYSRKIEDKYKTISYKDTVYDLITFKEEH